MSEARTAELIAVIERCRLRLERTHTTLENSLPPKQWHVELLGKMTLSIEGVRIAAISETSHANLLELLTFRHFQRYYSETEYDWDKLDLLVKKLSSTHPALMEDLSRFVSFLKEL